MLHCPILIKIVYSHCFPNVFCMPFIMIGQVPENLGFEYYNRKTELVSTLNFLQYYLMIFQSEA